MEHHWLPNGLQHGKTYKAMAPTYAAGKSQVVFIIVIPLQEVTGCSLGLFLVQDCTTER